MKPSVLMLGIAAAALMSDCGSGGDSRTLDVAAATSLKRALAESAGDLRPLRVRLAFAGSDVLAAQIRAGARPDVYVAASSELPRALAREGLVEEPVSFASNELVLAVPAREARVSRLSDLAADDVRIAVGAPSVPVGAYAERFIDRLTGGLRRRLQANIRSREPDVGGVIGKLSQGAVDAGFVYRTDVRAAPGRVVAISLPPRLRPRIVYAAAVVRGTDEPAAARRYVRDLTTGRGARALRAAGFLPAP